MAAQATINVRMNAALKQRGDRVLKEYGVSTTQAVSALWKQLAQTRTVPSFLLDENNSAGEAERSRKRAALDGIASIGCRQPRDSNVEDSDEALDNLRFRTMLEHYEDLA